MDLLSLIRTQINSLPAGPHQVGLKSVLHHIETAYKHFARGQSDGDESFFTDTIYRTNQAFEGSAKEAYRVLAGKDPAKMRPYDVEQYLEDNRIFRERILSQFTKYRTEWRNPAAHDYNLTFDEAEAFLAIVSVSAFTKLLVDEVAEKLNYLAVKRDVAALASSEIQKLDASVSLFSRVTNALLDFPKYYRARLGSVSIDSEAQLIGAIGGFLASTLPDAETATEARLAANKRFYVDLIVSVPGEGIFVEVKRGDGEVAVERGVEQLSTYLAAAKDKHGVLFLYAGDSTEYDVTHLKGMYPGIEINVLRPAPRFG
jgi:hypothetical protein